MYYVVPDLAKINTFKDAAIPSPREFYERSGFVELRPSSGDDSVQSYNAVDKLSQLRGLMSDLDAASENVVPDEAQN